MGTVVRRMAERGIARALEHVDAQCRASHARRRHPCLPGCGNRLDFAVGPNSIEPAAARWDSNRLQFCVYCEVEEDDDQDEHPALSNWRIVIDGGAAEFVLWWDYASGRFQRDEPWQPAAHATLPGGRHLDLGPLSWDMHTADGLSDRHTTVVVQSIVSVLLFLDAFHV